MISVNTEYCAETTWFCQSCQPQALSSKPRGQETPTYRTKLIITVGEQKHQDKLSTLSEIIDICIFNHRRSMLYRDNVDEVDLMLLSPIS